MQRLPWIERNFQFDIPPGWMYNITARLSGTEHRLGALVRDLPDPHTRLKPGDKWSIKEHIGHLGDLEVLHLKRLDDFEQRNPQLSTWDVTNTATEQAHHNDTHIDQLIRTFNERRETFLSRLIAFDDETHIFQSLHPRLKILMKPVDMASFIAEHDDHHIASIIELITVGFSQR